MVKKKLIEISGWGRSIREKCNLVEFNSSNLKNIFKEKKLIARGMGRSYGDSSIQRKQTINMVNHRQIIFFDKTKGILTVESGITIKDVINKIIPQGFFLPVTPGSKFVTIGGMVASNVHGKNHHIDGGFSNFIISFVLLSNNGKKKICSLSKNKDLFLATIGGMGLTGIILEVTFSLLKIETNFISQNIICAGDLRQTMKFFSENSNIKYTVAWIDCLARNKKLGRSIIFLGEHLTSEQLKKSSSNYAYSENDGNLLSIPFQMPSFILNNFTIRIFNFFYYHILKKKSSSIVSIDKFFYPLDKIKNWNLIYGKKGFLQYQFVIPLNKSYEGITEILQILEKYKTYPFLTVLKQFKKKDIGILSFPIKGYTLALDFPITDKIYEVLNKLDDLLIKYKGRIYLTKDSRIPSSKFHLMYKKEIKKFLNNKYMKNRKFNSHQSERLGI